MAPLPPTRDRPLIVPPGGAGEPSSAGPGRTGHPRTRRVLRVLLIAVLVIAALGAGAAAALAWFAKGEIDRLVTPKSRDVKEGAKELEAPLPGKPATILLLGSDQRGSTGPTDRRSDTMVLVRLDPKRETISVMSFPRDMYVEIPGQRQDRINEAYSLGGTKLAVQTVKSVTGLDVNFVVNVDFQGFRSLVDELGGVYVDVDRDYFNDNSEGQNFDALDIDTGYQLLDGVDALDYARFRHDDAGDYGRIARQQQMLIALKRQLSGSTIAKNVSGLFEVVHDNTDIGVGGGGSVSARLVIDYLRLGLALDGSDIYDVQFKGTTEILPSGAYVEIVAPAELDAAVQAFLEPDADARERSADQVAPGSRGEAATERDRPRTPELAPASVDIEVKNGSGVSGAATTTAGGLRAKGYEVVLQDGVAGNADNFSYATTVVRYSSDADKPAAEQVASLFEGATVEPADTGIQTDAAVLVIVGKAGATVTGGAGEPGGDSAAGGGTNPINRVPRKAPPATVADPEYGRDDFAGIGRLGVPVLYPTVREKSSTYEEVRAYRIAKGQTTYPAYRLVARTSSGVYWGLQGTAWPDPPLLADPTRELTRAGRTYLLYFNGTRLHRVAWKSGPNTYWVTNSLLDDLSNETMLAIAQGVRPFR